MTLTRKGWNSLKPITAPEQMSTPIHWNPMSDDWKRWIDSHQVYNGESRFSKEMLDAMKALHDKILSFGGDEVCMTAYDEDAVKTLSRGAVLLWQQLYAQGSAQSMSREFRLLWFREHADWQLPTHRKGNPRRSGSASKRELYLLKLKRRM